MQDVKKKRKIGTAKASCWGWFSKYIRVKYSHEGYCKCVSCNREGYWKGDGFQAGHMIAKGNGNGIYFLEEVIRPQCSQCNGPNGGMPDVTIPLLIEWYGKEKYEEFVRLKKTPLKLSVFDLEDMEAEFKRLAFEYADQRGIDRCELG